MDTFQINRALAAGEVDEPGVLPKLEELSEERFVFRMDFGLARLPTETGVIIIRGARQYGKSTWLQRQIKETVRRFGPGTAFYLNGDELRNRADLIERIRALIPLFESKAPVRRLFIDEITAVIDWQKALKILLDAGEFRNVLLVTTGSKAGDLRHGAERLPGRKGKLGRSAYIFTPVSFVEFKRVCASDIPGEHLLPAYLISGGSPPACAALASTGRLPEYIFEMVRDWVYGEFAASGRSRAMLLGVMECLYRFACTPVGQSKLAREAGLANNTVAAGYIDLLADLMCVAPSFAWDSAKKRSNRRRPCKFHLTNMLFGTAWHPRKPRSPREYLSLPENKQGAILEWTVAQECWRRAAIRGDEIPESMNFWQGGDHELDFVLNPESFLEVKRGKTSPLDFAWFPASFPCGRLVVISDSRYETAQITGVTMEDFLLGVDPH